MSALASRWRVWAIWLAPFAVLALVIGWETDWLRAFSRVPAPELPPTPVPVSVALLPDYQIPGGAEALKDTTERTLFNPTRRPAPTALADATRSQMRRGQFQLTGTTVFGDKGIAYLKETAGGKARSVKKGETINGMLVADVRPDRVKFTVGDESEELLLKVAAGPKTTIQPAVPGAAAPGGAPPATGAQPAAPAVAQALGAAGVGANANANATGTPLSLAERRRAARAAEAAAAAAHGDSGAVTGSSVPAPVVAPGSASTWQSMQQRYQQRNPVPDPAAGK
jgi:hypothetical protein